MAPTKPPETSSLPKSIAGALAGGTDFAPRRQELESIAWKLARKLVPAGSRGGSS